MPEIFRRNGWRILFYSVDRNEPPHVLCKKAEKDCKIFLNNEEEKIKLEYSFNMNSKDALPSKIILNIRFLLVY